MDDQLPAGFPQPIFPGQPIPAGLGEDQTPQDQKELQKRLQATIAEDQLKSSMESSDTRPPSEVGGLAQAIMQANGGVTVDPKSEIAKAMEEADRNAQLSPDELQRIREIIYTKSKVVHFQLPTLPITEADRDLFIDCVINRKTYKESFSMMKGKLKIVIREKLKRETEAVFGQIEIDFREGRINSESSFATRLQDYNLAVQLISINGAPMPQIVPIDPPEDWTLRDAMKGSVLETLSENTIFLLFSALTQFERKVKTMSEEVISENFTLPATGS